MENNIYVPSIQLAFVTEIETFRLRQITLHMSYFVQCALSRTKMSHFLYRKFVVFLLMDRKCNFPRSNRDLVVRKLSISEKLNRYDPLP